MGLVPSVNGVFPNYSTRRRFRQIFSPCTMAKSQINAAIERARMKTHAMPVPRPCPCRTKKKRSLVVDPIDEWDKPHYQFAP